MEMVTVFGIEFNKPLINRSDVAIDITNKFIDQIRKHLNESDPSFNLNDDLILLIDNHVDCLSTCEANNQSHSPKTTILIVGMPLCVSDQKANDLGSSSPFVFQFLEQIQPFSQNEVLSYLWKRFSDKRISVYSKLKDVILKYRSLFTFLSTPLNLTLLCDCCETCARHSDLFIDNIVKYSHEIDALEYVIFKTLYDNASNQITHSKFNSFKLAYKLVEANNKIAKSLVNNVGFEAAKNEFKNTLNVQADTATIRFFYSHLLYFSGMPLDTVISMLQEFLNTPMIVDDVFCKLHKTNAFIRSVVLKGKRNLKREEVEGGSFFQLNTAAFSIKEFLYNAQFIEPSIKLGQANQPSPQLSLIHAFFQLQKKFRIQQVLYASNFMFIFKTVDNSLYISDLLKKSNIEISDSKLPDGKAQALNKTINGKEYVFIVHKKNLIYFERLNSKKTFVSIDYDFDEVYYFQIEVNDIFSCLMLIDKDGRIFAANLDLLPELVLQNVLTITAKDLLLDNPHLNKIQCIVNTKKITKLESESWCLSFIFFMHENVRFLSLEISHKKHNIQVTHNKVLNGLTQHKNFVSSAAIQRASLNDEGIVFYVGGDYSLNFLDLAQQVIQRPVYFGSDRITSIIVLHNQNAIIYGDSNRMHILSRGTQTENHKAIYINMPLVRGILEVPFNSHDMLLVTGHDSHSLLPTPE